MRDPLTAPRRGGWPGPRKIQRTIDWPPDQYAAIEAYAERHGIKFAEAVRRLVAAGLAQPSSGGW